MTEQTSGSAKSSIAETAPLDVLTKAIGPATLSDEGDAADTGADTSDQTQSSSVTDAEKSTDNPEEKDLLSVVRDAVEGKKEDAKPSKDKAETDEDASSASGKGDKQEKQEKSSDEEEAADPTAEELAGYKPKTRKQIEKLLTQRREALERVTELEAPAQQYQQITSYMEEYGLTANDVAQAFTITALFKNDPARAREELMKRIDMLDQQIGNKLSDDLKKKVEDGSLDEEAALELSRSRANAERERQLREATEKKVETETAQRQEAEVRTKVQTAVTQWQQSKIQSDPDFSQKAEMLDAYVRGMVAKQGQPKTAEQALKMADEAYAAVNKQIERFRPAPAAQPKRVVQSRHVSGNPRPQPATPLDVVKLAVEGAK